jgi:hypothetical protein
LFSNSVLFLSFGFVVEKPAQLIYLFLVTLKKKFKKKMSCQSGTIF